MHSRSVVPCTCRLLLVRLRRRSSSASTHLAFGMPTSFVIGLPERATRRAHLAVSEPQGRSLPPLSALLYMFVRTLLGGFPLSFVSSFPSCFVPFVFFIRLYTSLISCLLSTSTSHFIRNLWTSDFRLSAVFSRFSLLHALQIFISLARLTHCIWHCLLG